MPQSKQMKLQWLTIDGRNVPFALPQHWNGDDWTITGVDNPLPTANYIEKNGIMVPVSENNPVPTQLTGSNVVYQFAYNDDIDPQTSFRIVEGVNISRFAKIIISFHFDTSPNRFYDLYGALLVQASRSATSTTGAFITDRIYLTRDSGLNRPYEDDPTRGAYRTDVLLIGGEYLFVDIENPHKVNAFLGLRTVVVKGVD